MKREYRKAFMELKGVTDKNVSLLQEYEHEKETLRKKNQNQRQVLIQFTDMFEIIMKQYSLIIRQKEEQSRFKEKAKSAINVLRQNVKRAFSSDVL